MENDTLYEQGRIKVTYLHNPEPGRQNEVVSVEDHELWLQDENNEWNNYIIQRGVLRELAQTAKRDADGLELVSMLLISMLLISMLDRVNPHILWFAQQQDIRLKDVANAFIGAYKKEQEDFEKYFAGQDSRK